MKINSTKILLYLLNLLLIIAFPALINAHPFHTTVAEMEFNPVNNSLEVSLRVFPNDLKKNLQLLYGKTPKHSNSNQNHRDQQILEFLRNSFIVSDTKGNKFPHTWIGKEVLAKHIWLYFEIPLAKGIKTFTIENRIFFDLETKQFNILNFNHKGLRNSFIFTPSSPLEKLNL